MGVPDLEILRSFGHAEIIYQNGYSGEFWLARFPGENAYCRGRTPSEAIRSAASKMAELGLAPPDSGK